MISSLTSLLSTVAGKAVVGVVVASTSVGAAAAAGAPVPFVASPADRPPVIVDEPAGDELAGDELAGDELAGDELVVTAQEPAGEEPAGEELVIEEPVVDEPAEPNHGDVVSSFVHATELEGCEKGQATAAVARGDIEPGADGTIDPAAVDAYLAEFLAESGKCADDDEQVPDEEASHGPAHGDVVSSFVHETELEGCQKGQATAAVARGDIEPDDAGVIDPTQVDEYLEASGACPNADDARASEVDATDADEQGKPDKTGKPERGGSSDRGGPPAGRGNDG